jgi:hypothetical protein
VAVVVVAVRGVGVRKILIPKIDMTGAVLALLERYAETPPVQ